MLALPPPGRRVPPPPRSLLLGLRSYGLMRQSRVALLYFGPWPRSWSLRRLLPAPAATGILPTLSLRIFPQMPGPMPRRSHRLLVPVSSSVSSAFPWAAEDWLPASNRETTFPRKSFRDCRHSFTFKPPSLLASQVVPTAVHAATGQLRLLGPGRTCFVASARTGHANRPNTGN
jgi:hypothetical protein